MKLITIRSQILGVTERWKKHYRETDSIVYQKLMELDLKTATPEMITAIIGNKLWACATTCNECNKKFNAVVECGESPDWESNTAWLCEGCLEKALSLIREGKPYEAD